MRIAQLLLVARRALFGAAILSCVGTLGPQVEVSSRAVSEDRESPLAGAAVQVPALALSAMSGSDGRFVLHLRPGLGCHWLWVRYIGYQPSYTEVAVTDSGASMADPVWLRPAIELGYLPTYLPGPCAATLRMEGVVVADGGSPGTPRPLPVAGAIVGLPDLGLADTTDAAGRFGINVPPMLGCHRVEVTSTEYRTLRTAVQNDHWRVYMRDTLRLTGDRGESSESVWVPGPCG
jgi:hypothetical protein